MLAIRNPINKILTVFVGLLLISAVLYLLDFPPSSKTNNDIQLVVDENPGMRSTPFIVAPINTPHTLPADRTTLVDDEEIIGVIVKGKERAYRVSAFDGAAHHVVNDLVEGVPVTVTHCDQTNCTRVFTDQGKAPLTIKMGGFQSGLVLFVDRNFYSQNSCKPLNRSTPPFPYEMLEFEQVPWGQWRVAHPNTDVYEGDSILKSKS